jgi:DNA-binding NarL/FixJ family response regulator
MTTADTTTTAFVCVGDPISRAGLAMHLRSYSEVVMVAEDEIDTNTVVIAVADRLSEDALRSIKTFRQRGSGHVVLVISEIEEADLFKAVEAGVTAIVRRADATAEAMVGAIRAVSAGDGSIPPDLLGRFLATVGTLQQRVLGPHGLSHAGFTERELDVLRLVAEGCDTHEIGERLCYSDRTIKSIIHDITCRLDLRNRSHAVAVAMRQGLL